MKKLVRITTVPISLDKLLGKQLSFMSNKFAVTAISANRIELEKVAKKYGVNSFHVEMTRQITPIKDLKALFKLYKYLRQQKPNIVHSHTPKAGTIGMIASKLAGVPIRLHTVAGLPLLEVTGPKRILLNLVEKITYACATKVLPNSYGLKEIILEQKYTTKSKLEVLANGSSNGIDIDYFSPKSVDDNMITSLREKLQISVNNFVYIFVGRLVKDKGINELITAFNQIKNPTVRLLLVGSFENDLDPLNTETLIEIRNNPKIIHVGWQEDVRPYFAVSNALVFPSYREGFPNVVLQAGAMGLPSIVSNINGCNEIIERDYNGIIVESKNDQDLFLAMQSLFETVSLYKKLQKNSRIKIINFYGQNVVWDAMEVLYRKELNKI